MLKSIQYKNIVAGQGRCSLLTYSIGIYLYAVDGLLIDTGPESLARESRKFLKENHITQVALTHVHEDHSGMAPWLQSEMNVPVYLHEKSIPAANKRGKYPMYRHMIWGARDAFNPSPMPEMLTTGKYTFEVIDAPGHSEQHNIFLEKNQGWLFTGDLYVGAKQYVSFHDENVKDTIASLENCLKLDFDTVFCAHSGIIEDGKTKLQMKLEYLKEIQERVNALRLEGLSDYEINKRLYPRIPLITRASRGEWSSYNLISTI